MPKIKVAGYGRMSTIDQRLSPEVQKEKISRWFQYKNESGRWPQGAEFIGMFIDEGVSSRVDMLERPKGNEILTVLDPGDVIVCATLSRAFRSAADAEKTLNKLGDAGITLQFVDMDIDSNSPTGKLFLGMVAIMARFERDIISERTKDALQMKRIRGEPVCGAPCGWKTKRINGTSFYIIDINRRISATSARNLFRQGLSRNQVERQIRHFAKKHKMKVPTSNRTLVSDAAAASLDFPKCSWSYASELLGFNINNVKFLLRDDHEQLKIQLKEKATSGGIRLWEDEENDCDPCTLPA